MSSLVLNVLYMSSIILPAFLGESFYHPHLAKWIRQGPRSRGQEVRELGLEAPGVSGAAVFLSK